MTSRLVQPFADLPPVKSVQWFDGISGLPETDRFVIVDACEWEAAVHYVRLPDGRVMRFFHLEIHFLNPTILRSMLATWKAFRWRNPEMLFTCADRDSEALDRLRTMFGFKKVMASVECTDGNERKMFVHRMYA